MSAVRGVVLDIDSSDGVVVAFCAGFLLSMSESSLNALSRLAVTEIFFPPLPCCSSAELWRAVALLGSVDAAGGKEADSEDSDG